MAMMSWLCCCGVAGALPSAPPTSQMRTCSSASGSSRECGQEGVHAEATSTFSMQRSSRVPEPHTRTCRRFGYMQGSRKGSKSQWCSPRPSSTGPRCVPFVGVQAPCQSLHHTLQHKPLCFAAPAPFRWTVGAPERRSCAHNTGVQQLDKIPRLPRPASHAPTRTAPTVPSDDAEARRPPPGASATPST